MSADKTSVERNGAICYNTFIRYLARGGKFYGFGTETIR